MSERKFGLEVDESTDEEPTESLSDDDVESELADFEVKLEMDTESLLEEIKNDLGLLDEVDDEVAMLYERMEDDPEDSPYGQSGCPMCNLVDAYTGTVETPQKVEQLKEATRPETHTHDQTCSFDEFSDSWLARYRNRVA